MLVALPCHRSNTEQFAIWHRSVIHSHFLLPHPARETQLTLTTTHLTLTTHGALRIFFITVIVISHFMDGKIEVQRETGHGQNLNPDKWLQSPDPSLLSSKYLLHSPQQISAEAHYVCVWRVGGAKFRKSPRQGMSPPSLTHKLTAESADSADRGTEVSPDPSHPQSFPPLNSGHMSLKYLGDNSSCLIASHLTLGISPVPSNETVESSFIPNGSCLTHCGAHGHFVNATCLLKEGQQCLLESRGG